MVLQEAKEARLVVFIEFVLCIFHAQRAWLDMLELYVYLLTQVGALFALVHGVN